MVNAFIRNILFDEFEDYEFDFDRNTLKVYPNKLNYLVVWSVFALFSGFIMFGGDHPFWVRYSSSFAFFVSLINISRAIRFQREIEINFHSGFGEFNYKKGRQEFAYKGKLRPYISFSLVEVRRDFHQSVSRSLETRKSLMSYKVCLEFNKNNTLERFFLGEKLLPKYDAEREKKFWEDKVLTPY